MGYAEGSTQGYTREDYNLDMMQEMCDILSTKVEDYLKLEDREDLYNQWNKISRTLIPHYEEYPYNWRTDKYGNEVCDYEQEIVSYADTYEDEIADICWLCGFNLDYSYDYDGSPHYCISVPSTFEQAEKNMADAKKYWEEVYG